MKIVIGADHGGYPLKEILRPYVESLGHEITDYGCFSKEDVDYPDYAGLIAIAVAKGEFDLGIMIDGAGVGSCMAANKILGVRAACCNEIYTTYNSRAHNHANVLTMGSMIVGANVAKDIVKTFLSTEPETAARHQRRVDKIGKLEAVSFQLGEELTKALTGLKPGTSSNTCHAKVITEEDINQCQCKKLVVGKKSIVTALATDRAKELGIELIRE